MKPKTLPLSQSLKLALVTTTAVGGAMGANANPLQVDPRTIYAGLSDPLFSKEFTAALHQATNEQVNTNTAAIDRLERQFSDDDGRVQKLEKAVEQNKSKLGQVTTDIESLKTNEIANLQNGVMDLIGNKADKLVVEGVITQLNDQSARIDSNERAINNLVYDVVTGQDTLRTAIANVEDDVDGLIDEVIDLNYAVDELADIAGELELQLNDKADKTEVKEITRGLLNTDALLAEGIASNAIGIAGNQTAITELAKVVDDNTQGINNLIDSLESIDQDLIYLDDTKADKTDLEKTDKKLNDLADVVGQNTARIDEVDNRVDEHFLTLSNDIQINKADIDANKTAIQDNKTDIAKLKQTKIDETVADERYARNQVVEDLEEQFKKQQETIEATTATANDNKGRLDRLEPQVTNLNNRMGAVEKRLDEIDDGYKSGMATQAALAGLFQPYTIGRANASVAIGGYESKTAIAVGAGYRFNESFAGKFGLATDGDNTSYNIGINYEW